MALVLAMSVMTALLTVAGSLTLLAATEARIAGRYRDGVTAFYAAEAALAGAIGRLRREPDWTTLVVPDGPAWQPLGEGVVARDAGGGMLTVRSEARVGSRARRALEVTVARNGGGVRVVLWTEVR